MLEVDSFIDFGHLLKCLENKAQGSEIADKPIIKIEKDIKTYAFTLTDFKKFEIIEQDDIFISQDDQYKFKLTFEIEWDTPSQHYQISS